MTDQPRQLATVRDYAELHQALRARAEELNVSRRTLDAISGLAETHCEKILAAVPIKNLGPKSMGPLLGALGLALIVVEDPEAMARVANRMVERVGAQVRAQGAHQVGLRAQRQIFRAVLARLGAKGASKGGRATRDALTPKQRSRSAARAARHRWRKWRARATAEHQVRVP